MTSIRSLALVGALVATLATSGCSFAGTSQTPTSPSDASSSKTRAPALPAPGTSTPSTQTPGAPASGTAPEAPAAPSPSSADQAPSSTAAPTGKQAPAAPPPGKPAGTVGSGDTDPGRCATQALAISVGLDGDVGGGTAGSTYSPIIMENTGSTTCTLDGFPGVSHVAGADGHQVGAAAARDGSGAAASRVSLEPGGSAYAPLRIVDYQGYPVARCQPTPVSGYRVYPPGSDAAAFVAGDGTTCAAPAVGTLSVGPVQAGLPPG